MQRSNVEVGSFGSFSYVSSSLTMLSIFLSYWTLSRTTVQLPLSAGTMAIDKVLVHVKDSIPPEQRSGVVYRIPCSECPKAYVGQTGRSLMQRVKEHSRALPQETASHQLQQSMRSPQTMPSTGTMPQSLTTIPTPPNAAC